MDYPLARIAVLAALGLTGCSMKHVQVRGEVVIPKDCIVELKADDNTLCHGPDGQHIKCEKVQLTRKTGCETFVVHSKTKGKK